jgi:long-chain acyl-CoA synthetase
MLYSSGTTGRPKGIKRPLTGQSIDHVAEMSVILQKIYALDDRTVYLSTAPLYHSAPLRFCMRTQIFGACIVVMEHFEPEQALRHIAKYRVTHSQWVPTMFNRLLKLPDGVRSGYDLSSHKVAIHGAAPCPMAVKTQMIAWWGPILIEYYGGTEGNGYCAINSAEWQAHPGSVGRAYVGTIKILDDDNHEVPVGQEGTVYFAGGPRFEYHNDPAKTAEAFNGNGWSTLGDVGRLDSDGYLYLTDRKAFMIISGGVNIYPQEAENILISHPQVGDVAVIGIPNEEFGEEVKAVVQPMDMFQAGPELEAELLAFCRARLSAIKCPCTIDFVKELPRHATGKLYKKALRDGYWAGRQSRIV